jgi:hypothetical protein
MADRDERRMGERLGDRAIEICLALLVERSGRLVEAALVERGVLTSPDASCKELGAEGFG